MVVASLGMMALDRLFVVVSQAQKFEPRKQKAKISNVNRNQ